MALPGFKEEDNEQYVKMYTYYLDLCGTHPHPELHRKLNFNVNSATIRNRFLRERPFGKAIVFDESKLKNYGTAEEVDEALSKGSQNGSVAIIFGAQHCVELFLSKYCDNELVKRFDHQSPYPVRSDDNATSSQSVDASSYFVSTPSSSSTSNQ
ncbi:hypothetical protein QQP08_006635, partial [Theobroma cacao]